MEVLVTKKSLVVIGVFPGPKKFGYLWDKFRNTKYISFVPKMKLYNLYLEQHGPLGCWELEQSIEAEDGSNRKELRFKRLTKNKRLKGDLFT